MGKVEQVSHVCTLLAIKRGADPELAAIAGMLHDIAYINCYEDSKYKPHDENNKPLDVNKETHSDVGAIIARKLLLENKIVSLEEADIICRAITRHNKGNVDHADTLIDEILKDSDVFAHGLTSVSERKTNFRGSRWDKVCQELGMDNCRGDSNEVL